MAKIEVIEINGRRYDTRSGAVLHKSKGKSAGSGDAKSSATIKTSKPLAASTQPKTQDSSAFKPRWHKKTDSVHQLAKHRTPHSREKASTLLRIAVKKPSLKKESSRLSAISLPMGSSLEASEAKGERIDVSRSTREQRAKDISKNELVHKFNAGAAANAVSDIKQIEVKQSPASHHESFPFTAATPKSTPNPFDTAVERAHSHEVPTPKAGFNFSLWWRRFIMTATLFLVVSAAVLYVEAPKLDLSLAAYRSGVALTVPSSVPAGYTFKTPVSYTAGQVVLTFINGNSAIQINEEATNWNSNGLLANFVILSDQSYKTLSYNGQVIYVLSDGSATWVNGNVWYQLLSTSPQSASSLEKLASST